MHTFKRKNNRAGHIIILIAVLFLMSVTGWAFFMKEEPIPLEGNGLIIASVIGVIGAVVVFMSLKNIITDPTLLTLTEDGFEYNPSGVSSGFMHWKNVAELKFVDVRTQQGQLNGPIWEQTLAIKFKDPSLYRDQFNAVMKGLMKVNESMYDADMFFRLSDFGKQSEEIYQLMMKYWNQSKNVSVV
jgi:hypothetical protein